MPWYDGKSLLELLETLPAYHPRVTAHCGFSIQTVVRPNQDFRGYSGQVGSGTIRPGQEVMALPSRQRTTVKEILLYDKVLDGSSTWTVGRADHGRSHRPRTEATCWFRLMPRRRHPARITAYLVWLSHAPLHKDTRYLVKHTTRVLVGKVARLNHKIEINTFDKHEADSLQFNEIGEVELDLHSPIFCDPYQRIECTGSFIVIDPIQQRYGCRRNDRRCRCRSPDRDHRRHVRWF